MDWSALKVLEKAPRKKYIRKLVEYAAMVVHRQSCLPTHVATPVSQQFPQDLELTSEECHQLVSMLGKLIVWSQSVHFHE